MESKTIDVEVLKEYAEKLPEFEKRNKDLVDAMRLVHEGRTPQYYRDLFIFAKSHYSDLTSMKGDAEIRRFVANGALMAYAADKIIYPENLN